MSFHVPADGLGALLVHQELFLFFLPACLLTFQPVAGPFLRQVPSVSARDQGQAHWRSESHSTQFLSSGGDAAPGSASLSPSASDLETKLTDS